VVEFVGDGELGGGVSSLGDLSEEEWMTSQAVVAGLEVPTEDERTMAMLAHLLMAFTGFIGPLVIFCVKQNSRFVRFHSLQALIWHAIYLGVIFAFMAVFFVVMMTSLIHNPPQPHSQVPPPFFYVFPFIWLGFMGGWVVNVILGVVYAIKANRGEWATYPVYGKWLLPR
jgi:uncharacterized Tic20 family protein